MPWWWLESWLFICKTYQNSLTGNMSLADADTRSGTRKLVQLKERTKEKLRTQLDRRCQRRGREALHCFLKEPRAGLCQAAGRMCLNSCKGDHRRHAFTSRISVPKTVFFISQVCSVTESQERGVNDLHRKANSSKSQLLLLLTLLLFLPLLLLLLLFFPTPLGWFWNFSIPGQV